MNIALIPARSGSKRIKDKNIKSLGGKPLVAHTFEPVLASNKFEYVAFITDSYEYARVAEQYPGVNIFHRPDETARDDSPDFAWVTWIHKVLKSKGIKAQTYSILRPTSPFRTIETIFRAFECFSSDHRVDTLRAVQAVTEHPGKMWLEKCGAIVPLLPFRNELEFWHNNQTNTLPEVLVQNASFEIFLPANIEMYGSITGNYIKPFKTLGIEGFDINTEDDFLKAEELIQKLN